MTGPVEGVDPWVYHAPGRCSQVQLRLRAECLLYPCACGAPQGVDENLQTSREGSDSRKQDAFLEKTHHGVADRTCAAARLVRMRAQHTSAGPSWIPPQAERGAVLVEEKKEHKNAFFLLKSSAEETGDG